MGTIFQGIVIGIANIIPGVSGGTMALVLGIYKRTISAVRNVDLMFIRNGINLLLGRDGAWATFKQELERVDTWFLVRLAIGVLVALVATSHLMEYLLEHHHAPSFAFFMGLVLFSMAVPYRYLKRKSWREGVAFILAAILTISLSFVVPEQDKIDRVAKKIEMKQAKAAAETEQEERGFISFATPSVGMALWIFLAAGLAVSAMVLPGISGSFVLLLLGIYFDILQAVNQREIITLGIFLLGVAFGLLVFVRIMHVLLNRFYNVTMAFMIGLMVGSLYELWPFKKLVTVHGEQIFLGPQWPASFSQEVTSAIATFIMGAAIVCIFMFLDRKRDFQAEFS